MDDKILLIHDIRKIVSRKIQKTIDDIQQKYTKNLELTETDKENVNIYFN